MSDRFDIIVSGHLCLDLLPDMPTVSLAALSSPGKLFEIGPISMSTGGSVSNTGLALQRLGGRVSLQAHVGSDLLGRVIIAFLKDRDPALADHIETQDGQASSYSVLLSPQNMDRIILHCTGTNAIFSSDHVNYKLVAQAKVFHLGYPPLLPRLIEEDGVHLQTIYERVSQSGVVTSLDLALPDPDKAAGQADWQRILQRSLPFVDVFLPSIEEIIFMMRRPDYDAWHGRVLENIDRAYLADLADELLAAGPAIVGFKLGPKGFYLRSAGAERIKLMSKLDLDSSVWADQEAYHPAFEVKVVGTTGAGDSAYAAFLIALLHSYTPAQALELACAVGACNVEAHDATSSIRNLEDTLARIRAGWPHSGQRLRGFEN